MLDRPVEQWLRPSRRGEEGAGGRELYSPRQIHQQFF